MESYDSPEIPDRGETSDIPGLPSGDPWGEKTNHRRQHTISELEIFIHKWSLEYKDKS